MNKLLEKNLERLKKFCHEFDVDKLHAFGSITSKNFNVESDIDLLVKFKNIPYERYADNYFRLHELLEQLFKRKVDLVTENSLSNPYFIKSINRTKTLIYER